MPNSFNGNFNRAIFFYNYVGALQDLIYEQPLLESLWGITSKGSLIFKHVFETTHCLAISSYHNI